ncbi:hypothetical protein [Caenimonas sp. SL110]|uniref:hypothetical protein n=1 Tax=Caenimonas sp. SL110 TaxID=1450524 RepID=UPI0006534367|nr:hypothetical protein [Caenimonas sp. SL110]
MATFYKTSTVWVLDFTYEGRPRRWVKAFPTGENPRAAFEAQIAELYGRRGQVVDVRLATADEETQFLRGTLPKNVLCPTGRGTPRV